MRIAVLGALLFFAVFAAPLWNAGPVPEARPDPALALAVAIALRVPPASAGAIGFATGVVLAAAAGRSPGAFMVSRTVVAFAVGYVRRLVLGESVWVTVLVAWGASIACDLVFYAMSPKASAASCAVRSLTGATLNAFCAAPAYYVARWALYRPALVLPRE